MKRRVAVWMMFVMLVAAGPQVVAAQHNKEGQQQSCGQAGPQEPSTGRSSTMCCGMMGTGMGRMACPMMGMMPMMHRMGGSMMDPSESDMMAMMSSGKADPKTVGRMLQIRGEMLKAMGEILLKHGRLMEEGK